MSALTAWKGSFKPSDSSQKVLPIAPLVGGGGDGKREREDDDNDDEDEKELKKRREELEQLEKRKKERDAQRTPQRIAELTKRIAEKETQYNQLGMEIGALKFQLDKLKLSQISQTDVDAAIAIMRKIREDWEDEPVKFGDTRNPHTVFAYVYFLLPSGFDRKELPLMFTSQALVFRLWYSVYSDKLRQNNDLRNRVSATRFEITQQQLEVLKKAKAQIKIVAWRQKYYLFDQTQIKESESDGGEEVYGFIETNE